MAFPPRLRLMGEIFLIYSLVSYSVWFMFPLGGMAFFAGVYSLLLYSMVQHGNLRGLVNRGGLIGGGVNSMVFLFWVPLNMIIAGSDFLVRWFYLGSRMIMR